MYATRERTMFYAISVMREERWDGERGRVGAWNDHKERMLP
jgi:hypothetical protein